MLWNELRATGASGRQRGGDSMCKSPWEISTVYYDKPLRVHVLGANIQHIYKVAFACRQDEEREIWEKERERKEQRMLSVMWYTSARHRENLHTSLSSHLMWELLHLLNPSLS